MLICNTFTFAETTQPLWTKLGRILGRSKCHPRWPSLIKIEIIKWTKAALLKARIFLNVSCKSIISSWSLLIDQQAVTWLTTTIHWRTILLSMFMLSFIIVIVFEWKQICAGFLLYVFIFTVVGYPIIKKKRDASPLNGISPHCCACSNRICCVFLLVFV